MRTGPQPPSQEPAMDTPSDKQKTLDDEFAKYLAFGRTDQPRKMEALGQLAGGVAHDFNNILMIIDGFARMMDEVRGDDEKFALCLERIQKTITRGTGLTRKLLAFGRHDVIDDHVIDLGAFLHDQLQLLRPLVSEALDLHVEADEGLCIHGIEDDLSQILINLVTNARDALPLDRGAIAVAAYRSAPPDNLVSVIPADARAQDYICLRVVDSGKGMDAETLERVFEPFFTTKDQGKGTGLGLSMVYGLVRRMGGYVDLRSTPGQGTMIRLYFPLACQFCEARNHCSYQHNEAPIKADGAGLKDRTVLLVEDEDDLREILSHTLTRKGLIVIPASNGNDALLKQHEYQGQIDFMLTDIVMPELDGIRLAELLQEIRPEMETIFMSGYPERRALAERSLPQDSLFLAKPVSMEDLTALMVQRGARQAPVPQWRLAALD